MLNENSLALLCYRAPMRALAALNVAWKNASRRGWFGSFIISLFIYLHYFSQPFISTLVAAALPPLPPTPAPADHSRLTPSHGSHRELSYCDPRPSVQDTPNRRSHDVRV